jgi:hypothetical protein
MSLFVPVSLVWQAGTALAGPHEPLQRPFGPINVKAQRRQRSEFIFFEGNQYQPKSCWTNQFYKFTFNQFDQ